MHSDRAVRRLATHRPLNEVINDGAENGHLPIPSIAAGLDHAGRFARSQTFRVLQKRSKHRDAARKRRRPKAAEVLDFIQVVHGEVEQVGLLPPSKSRTQSPQMVTISANFERCHSPPAAPGGKVVYDDIEEYDETTRLLAMSPIEVGFIFHNRGQFYPRLSFP
ncbi:MAG: hypothetical protein ABIQ35_00715 [Verrucomicrobiota bacterium]